jgi:carboxylate-amine ligase
MPEDAKHFTLGIEEEYQIVDAQTGALRPIAGRVREWARRTLGEDEVQHELYLSQIETASPVCETLAEAREHLQRLRGALHRAAAKAGGRIAAAGTHPFSHWDAQAVTPKERYEGLAATFQQLVRELVIFGCHVHVGMPDREAALRVMNQARVWLAPLLALSANSPFWLGEDTGYASFRTELWGRFPMAGPPHRFADLAEHDALVEDLIRAGAIRDATNLYWDIRIPERVPTIEFRVADVCLTIDEAVMVAGLVRALARTCHEAAERDRERPAPAVRPELLRAAHWQAARHGLDGELIDVAGARLVPAGELIGSLLSFTRAALEASGDWYEVSALVEQTLARGNGAARQRQAFTREGRIDGVVAFITAETAKGVPGSVAGGGI